MKKMYACDTCKGQLSFGRFCPECGNKCKKRGNFSEEYVNEFLKALRNTLREERLLTRTIKKAGLPRWWCEPCQSVRRWPMGGKRGWCYRCGKELDSLKIR